MIDLARTAVIVNSWPDYQVDYLAFAYFSTRGLPVDNFSAVKCDGVPMICARNRIINTQVLPRIEQFDWFIFLDKDITPTAKTDPFLEDVKADIVGCHFPCQNENAWSYPDNFHAGIWRARGEVFTKVKSPWFKIEYDETYQRVTNCDCGYFRDRAKEASLEIVRQGTADHGNANSWHGGNN